MPTRRMQLTEDEAKLIEAHRQTRRDYATAFNAGVDKCLHVVAQMRSDHTPLLVEELANAFEQQKLPE